jgi:hypothetical protein
VQNEAAQSFLQAGTFLGEVAQIEKQISPNTKTTIDELGTMDPLGSTTVYPNYTVPDEYWVCSGGIYAYIFSKLAVVGIDAVGESQLNGYPGQYPSVSLIDYHPGGNPWRTETTAGNSVNLPPLLLSCRLKRKFNRMST